MTKVSEPIISLSEAQIKRAIEDYLAYGKNQGKWWFCRLNAGSFVITNPNGSHRRRIQGVEEGTADYLVLQPGNVQATYLGQEKGVAHPVCFVTFLEIKSPKGKTTQEQDEFAERAIEANCRYFIVRSVGEVEEALIRP